MDVGTQTLAAPRLGAKRAGIIFLVALFALILLDVVVARLLTGFFSRVGFISLLQTEEQREAIRQIVLTVANPIVIMLTALILLKRFFSGAPLYRILEWAGLKRAFPVTKSLAGLMCGAGYVSVFLMMRQVFPPSEATMPHPDNVINSAPFGGKLVFAFAVCTLVPVAEEFLFRGVLYQGISERWGKVASALTVSLMFIAVHPATIESGYWVTHAALYIFPFVLILLREVADTLHAPIAAHVGFNVAEIFF